MLRGRFALLVETVFLVESIHTTVGFVELLLTGVEWVGIGSGFNTDQWVRVAVFPFNSFCGRNC